MMLFFIHSAIHFGSKLRDLQTKLLFYFWKFTQTTKKYKFKYMNDQHNNKIFEAVPHISDRFEGIGFSQCAAKELKLAHDRLDDLSYQAKEPNVMTSHELYKLFSATHVGLNMNGEGWISFACMCNEDEAKFDKHLDCIGVKLNHAFEIIDYIMLTGNHIVSTLDDDLSKNARYFAMIAYWHHMGIHSHNYVHFHLSTAFAVAVKEGVVKNKSHTRRFFEEHVKFNLMTNENGLGGAVSDGENTSVLFHPTTPVSMDVTVFNEAAVHRTYLFFSGKNEPDVSKSHNMLKFYKPNKRRLCFGFPFTYDDVDLHEIENTAQIPFFAKSLVKYYKAYLIYFESLQQELDKNELASLQNRIGELCKSLGKHEIIAAKTSHFFATLMFLSGAFHSTDHGVCNAVVEKFNFPCFSIAKYSETAQLWDRKSLIISENFRKIAIDNVGSTFYESISHRQDILKEINGIRNHKFCLNVLNNSLNETKTELVEYLQVNSFFIYPSIAH
jgi:hypothetical protein